MLSPRLNQNYSLPLLKLRQQFPSVLLVDTKDQIKDSVTFPLLVIDKTVNVTSYLLRWVGWGSGKKTVRNPSLLRNRRYKPNNCKPQRTLVYTSFMEGFSRTVTRDRFRSSFIICLPNARESFPWTIGTHTDSLHLINGRSNPTKH